MEDTKQCCRCQQARPVNRFSARADSKDGLRNICKDCYNVRTCDLRRVDPARFRENERRYRERDPERYRLRQRSSWERNKKKKQEANRRYRQNNIERCRRWVAEWGRKNRDRRAGSRRYRAAAELRAVPIWASVEAIRGIYLSARSLSETTGKLWTVDHIVPLQNALVCGLHCEANLRVIPGTENFAKCNRWWPDMPGAA